MRLTVDLRCVLSLVGTILKWLSLPLLVPLFVALGNGHSGDPFVVTILLTTVVGFLLERLDPDPDLGLKESFLLVSLAWLTVALMGSVPYLVEGQGSVASPVNAFFESMSGFTTTGATVMADISLEQHSPSLMLWRQLSQWLGGMGIIVLGIAILPRMSVGGSELIKAEAPGPDVERLTPRIVETARRLWLIYALLTLTLFVLLYGSYWIGYAPNMNLYNAVSHVFTTMPTGGFSPEARSIEAFSPVVQWIIIPFMFLAGTNFALQWYCLTGKPEKLVGDAEFLTYFGAVVAFSTFLYGLLMVGGVFGSVQETVRHSLFQILTFVTTTGYASHDFNLWGSMPRTLLFIIMFLGGCTGSTGGGIKVLRWLTTVKMFGRDLFQAAFPRSVSSLRIGGSVIPDSTARRMMSLILLYIFTFFVGMLLIEFDAYRVGTELKTVEVMTSVAACLGNIGPGLGVVGPMNNYLFFSPFSKLVLSFLMWAGRLELFTLFVILIPRYWRV